MTPPREHPAIAHGPARIIARCQPEPVDVIPKNFGNGELAIDVYWSDGRKLTLDLCGDTGRHIVEVLSRWSE